ncbi:hypothetical protein GTV32_13370 [Gordonia sp. SID5947]|uniref:hypothetical protein n=1 Tax=Gordonia sp. SID5947 TaxID=2690315 RepID=UPI0013722AA7|nr:hypothetical protein [Gordonia sp. SID5947]MYR07235.1 hypothetical protein [Gordonia sp. SID5947]
MRRVLLSLTVFLSVGLFLQPGFQPGSANALGIGGIQFPDIDPPVSIGDQDLTRAKPEWLPPALGENASVILVPGTTDYDGSDQMARTAGIGFYDSPDGVDHQPPITIVDYPAAFGLNVFGIRIDLAGVGTFNDSVDAGTATGVDDAYAAWRKQGQQGTVIVNGYSQSGPVAMNIAYELHKDYVNGVEGAIPDENIVVVVGADSRFPNTGVENVVPSFMDGMYTNGDRDPADTGDIKVISYCVQGDATCGVGNPFADPIGTFFYLIPGFYTHAFLESHVNDYTEVKKWDSDDGNTTYVVLKGDGGGNPWGMMLRDVGIPVPKEVDEALNTLIPVPMPGEQAEIGGHVIPTPRELQEQIYERLGWTVPATDPDVLDKRAPSDVDPTTPAATTPAATTPAAPTPPVASATTESTSSASEATTTTAPDTPTPAPAVSATTATESADSTSASESESEPGMASDPAGEPTHSEATADQAGPDSSDGRSSGDSPDSESASDTSDDTSADGAGPGAGRVSGDAPARSSRGE